MDNNIEAASAVQNQYKDGLSYKKQQGYLDNWAEYERFRAGDQWPQPTSRTKDLPRPVFNVIDQIQGHKVSSVMNENIKMIYTATESEEGEPEFEAADTFTRFSDATWERIKQDDLNEEALDSGSNVGTCIWHYYWDVNKYGGNKLKYKGEMCGETIDPVNFFPGNPQQRLVQKQPYIIITHRDDVANVREAAKGNGVSEELIALINPDSNTEDQAYDKAKDEITGSKKVTVLTKYYKKDEIIHFTKVAGKVVIQPETSTRKKLYPLEVMQWKRRKMSIFGIGDTEGLIPNQKSINFLIAMQILSIQNTGMPRMLIKKEFIRQNPTNTPGEILVDGGPPGTWNAQYMQPGTMSPQAQGLVDNIMTYTKEVSGANESAMGEQISSDLNASAIMMLQKAAGIPIESVKRRFYQSMENIGRIWEEFWKVHYNTDRAITLKDDDEESYTRTFKGTEHKDTEMSLKIDIGPSSSYSETLMMSSLDKLFDTQAISLEQYLKFAPRNVIPFKDRLLKEVQEQMEQQQLMEQEQMEQQQQLDDDMQQQQTDELQRQQDEELRQQLEAQEKEAAEAPHEFDQILATWPQHEQEQFKKLSPQEQKAIMEQVMAEQEQTL
ncbi:MULTISPECIES: hypothetical protein [unclassified Peribacillus]|uniref:hypothetical protein n=1 Tax=unclassified Peribacillus TaxID=2675266 RepID=UPI0036725491